MVRILWWCLVAILALPPVAHGQNVTGNTISVNDVTGAYLRAPRLTQQQRDSTLSYLPGSIVFCTDCGGLQVRSNAGTWVAIEGGGTGPGGGVGGTGIVGQVALWATGTSIGGNAGLTYTSSILTANNLRVPGPAANVVVNPNPGYWPPGGFTSIFANVDTTHPADAEAAAVLFTHNSTGQGSFIPRYGAVISTLSDLATSSELLYGARISTSLKAPAPALSQATALEIITNAEAAYANRSLGILLSNNGPAQANAALVVSGVGPYQYGLQIQTGAVTSHSIDLAGNPIRAISIGGSPTFGVYQIGSSVLNRLEGGAIMGPVSALPSFGNQGRLMVRTSDNTLHLDTGSAWSQLGASSGSGHIIEEETTPLTQRATMRFTGSGVVASDDGTRTVVTIPGAAGSTGTTNYRWRTATSGTPASGDMRGNNATIASITQLAIAETDALGQDQTAFLGQLVAGDGLHIQDQSDSTKYSDWLVTAAPTDAGTFRTIPVTFNGSGVAIVDNAPSIARFKAGNLQLVTGGGTIPEIAYFQSGGGTGLASVPGFTWVSSKLTAPNFTITATPAMSINPTANASIATLNSLNVQTSTSSTSRVFAGHFGLTTTGGAAGDKVALYSALRHQGGFDAWSFNTVLTQESGSGSYNAQGYELDFNNQNAHRGDGDAGSGLGAPVSYGMSITGASAFRSTAAMLIGGITPKMWNRGILIANDSISATGSSFQDLTNPHKSIDIRGAPTYGVYQSAATANNLFAGGAILGPVSSLPAPGNAGRVLYRTTDNLLYADSGTAWNPITGGAAAAGFAVFNVKNYGALGNDAANDTTSIQNAADATCTAGGGTLYFPPGRYRITSHIAINCGMVVQGDGWGDKASTSGLGGSAIIATTATQDHLRVNAPNEVIIRALALRTNVTKTAGAAIRFMGYNGGPTGTSCFTQNPGTKIENVMMGSVYGPGTDKVWDGVTNQDGGLCTAYMDSSVIAFINRGVDMSQGEGGISVVNSYVIGTSAGSIAAVNADVSSSFLHSQGPTTVLADLKPKVLTVSLTRSGSTVTGTTTVPTGFVSNGICANQGDCSIIRVQGAGSNYNGLQTVTGVPTPFTFTYSMAGTTTPGSGTVRFDSILAEGAAIQNNIIECGQSTVCMSIQMQNTLSNTSRITGNSFYGGRAGLQVAQVAGLTPATVSNWTAFSITGNVFQLSGNLDGSCIDINNAQDGVIAGNTCNVGSTTGNTAGLVLRENTRYIDVGVNQTGANVDTPYTLSSLEPTSIRTPVYQVSSGTVFINTPFTLGNDQIRIHSAASTPNGANIVLQGNTDVTSKAGKTLRVVDGNFEVMNSDYNAPMLRVTEVGALAADDTSLLIRQSLGPGEPAATFSVLKRVRVGAPGTGPGGSRMLYVDP